jgi:hypothetical protein
MAGGRQRAEDYGCVPGETLELPARGGEQERQEIGVQGGKQT